MPEISNTFNDQLHDGLVRHQIGLLRVAGGTSKDAIERLNETDDKMRKAIIEKLPTTVENNKSNKRKIEALILLLLLIRKKIWDKLKPDLLADAKAIGLNEAAFMAGLVASLSPVLLDLTDAPKAAQVNAIISNETFEGRTYKQWLNDLIAADRQRIAAGLRIGLAQEQKAADIAARIVGTKALKGTDGVTETTRQQLKSLIRTVTNHVGNRARQEFTVANADIMDKELFVAVLDSRTTPICRATDGEIFPVGQGLIPPLHMNCRSIRIPVLSQQALSIRPMKPTTEKQLALEWSDGQYKSRAELPRNQRTKFDAFAKKRLGQMIGFVPAGTTYQEFLKRQSKAFQVEVLGVTKQKLFAKGGLTLDKFVNRQGDELTLAELAKLEKDAFAKAGLDPAQFN